MTKAFYPIVIVQLSDEDGGGYAAYAPDLYGCISDGDTPEEAMENVRAAIDEWCDETERLGREVPEPGSAIKKRAEERKALVAMIKEQDRLLTDKLDRIEGDIEDVKDRIRAFIESEVEDKGSLEAWGGGVALPGNIAIIRHRRSSEAAH